MVFYGVVLAAVSVVVVAVVSLVVVLVVSLAAGGVSVIVCAPQVPAFKLIAPVSTFSIFLVLSTFATTFPI